MGLDGIDHGISDVPIVIFSFDRPDYLDAVCRGLLGQAQVRADPSRVHLMQDGAVSSRTRRFLGRPALIARCIEVFRAHFPQGHVHAAPHNLGIAENILRGQRLVFEALGSGIGYFFEDDLEPGPYYLAAMEAMRRATEPFAGQVGMFAAYGRHREQLPGPVVKYCALGHQWAFGLRREAWQRIQAWLPDWWEEIRRNDYSARNKRRLMEVWRSRRVARAQSTQDAAMLLACTDLRLARLGIDVCFGRYIGEHGQHFTPTVFRRLGFHSTTWAAGDHFTFEPLTKELVARVAEEAFAEHSKFREEEFDQALASMDGATDDPDRLVTEAEVRLIWHLLLDRRDVPGGYLARHAGKTTLRDLRRAIVRREDFRRVTGV